MNFSELLRNIANESGNSDIRKEVYTKIWQMKKMYFMNDNFEDTPHYAKKTTVPNDKNVSK